MVYSIHDAFFQRMGYGYAAHPFRFPTHLITYTNPSNTGTSTSGPTAARAI